MGGDPAGFISREAMHRHAATGFILAVRIRHGLKR
jgi:hypothetical protein